MDELVMIIASPHGGWFSNYLLFLFFLTFFLKNPFLSLGPLFDRHCSAGSKT